MGQTARLPFSKCLPRRSFAMRMHLVLDFSTIPIEVTEHVLKIMYAPGSDVRTGAGESVSPCLREWLAPIRQCAH